MLWCCRDMKLAEDAMCTASMYALVLCSAPIQLQDNNGKACACALNLHYNTRSIVPVPYNAPPQYNIAQSSQLPSFSWEGKAPKKAMLTALKELSQRKFEKQSALASAGKLHGAAAGKRKREPVIRGDARVALKHYDKVC
jgi:hypothetical protein